ncbi:MAG: MacB family efflux pump subunit [Burkholderiales bacterium]
MSPAATQSTQPLIALRDLTKTYQSGTLPVRVLHGITLSIFEGEFIALMGQSGSGKTTLMNILGCLDRPTSGSYVLGGRDVSLCTPDELALLRSTTFGFIFQRYNLIATESALENVEMPAIYAGIARRERRVRARGILDSLGIGERLDHRPAQLSGGQQQRVSIARALMNGGRIILADEPTGALDSKSGAEVMGRLHELNREGHTIILITHDAAIANEAHRIIQIKDGLVLSDSGPAPGTTPHPSALPSASAPRQRSSALVSDISEAAKMAMRSLRVNLFRTVLTLLGIIIGVGAVVAMMALGDGTKQAVLSRIEAMGTDLLVVRPGAKNVRTREERASLVAEDAEAIAELPNVLRVAPEYDGAVTVRYADTDVVTEGVATSADYAAARNWPLAQGAFFSKADLQSFAPVVVLGDTVATTLFSEETNVTGRNILVNNIPFQVVGVLHPKGATSSGRDMDDVIFVPLSTGQMRLFGRRYVRSITIQVEDVKKIDAVRDAAHALLEERHQRVDFRIRNMASLLETATETQDTLTLLLASIAAISLIVGGIGVMNIMLVSVTERVREIGIRMACGAQQLHILLQFMTEALVVCSAGGLIGVAGGLGTARIFEYLGSPVAYSLVPVLLAFGSAFGIGLLFGFLPARRAAKLDPVVALAQD